MLDCFKLNKLEDQQFVEFILKFIFSSISEQSIVILNNLY